jgi:hypothetical protein
MNIIEFLKNKNIEVDLSTGKVDLIDVEPFIKNDMVAKERTAKMSETLSLILAQVNPNPLIGNELNNSSFDSVSINLDDNE